VRAAALLAAGLLLAACNQPMASPTLSPAPELAVLSDPDGGPVSGYSLLRTGTGTTLAELPPGRLAYALNGGGDIAEAYLTVSAAGGGSEIDAVLPNQSFALKPLATADEQATAAVLTRGDLATFVGQPTVLLLLTRSGRLLGYQHGKWIWSTTLSGDAELRQLGESVYAGDSNGWAAIKAGSGSLGPRVAASSCQPGPVAALGGQPLLDCSGTVSGSLTSVPVDPPTAVQVAGAALLLFAGGDVWRAGLTSVRRLATGIRSTAAPVAAPDGAAVYIPSPAGVERLDPNTGSHDRFLSATGVTSIALSRDGNFVYVIAGGRFTTYATAGGARIGSFATRRTEVYLLAGG
jgi:hypothetical protein